MAKLSLDENSIVLGTLDHVQNPKIGELCAIVRCHRVHNLPIPSGHEYVRDFFANRLSLRLREDVAGSSTWH